MNDTREPMSVGRLEAFSDGVFAIAITLLVLEIRLPAGEGDLLGRLLHLWPSYLAYVISFLLIGMIWMNHHRMFHHIRRVDGTLLGLNVLLLMSVSFLPFPTHVLAEALHDRHDSQVAAGFYGTVLVIGGVFYNAVWCYASIGHRLLGDTITPAEARTLRIRWGLGPVLYLVATLLGLWSAAASLVLYILLLLFYFFDLRPRRAD
ncbi:TMEM175 family protein [Longispora sp. K20-0274]|uniref:TMEM175 family protein n=1 Tax=Longispora sp. K20-0274 TaxID=3088255 RepID=UPI00399B1200